MPCFLVLESPRWLLAVGRYKDSTIMSMICSHCFKTTVTSTKLMCIYFIGPKMLSWWLGEYIKSILLYHMGNIFLNISRDLYHKIQIRKTPKEGSKDEWEAIGTRVEVRAWRWKRCVNNNSGGVSYGVGKYLGWRWKGKELKNHITSNEYVNQVDFYSLIPQSQG